jgi:hypothetical protein
MTFDPLAARRGPVPDRYSVESMRVYMLNIVNDAIERLRIEQAYQERCEQAPSDEVKHAIYDLRELKRVLEN